MGTEWHTGIVEDEVGHSGAKQLFSGMVVWSIFHNGIQVKSSLYNSCWWAGTHFGWASLTGDWVAVGRPRVLDDTRRQAGFARAPAAGAAVACAWASTANGHGATVEMETACGAGASACGVWKRTTVLSGDDSPAPVHGLSGCYDARRALHRSVGARHMHGWAALHQLSVKSGSRSRFSVLPRHATTKHK